MGVSLHSEGPSWDFVAADGRLVVWASARRRASMEGDDFPDQGEGPMQSDPFLDFHQTAERAGYPALLIVSMVALGLVVAPVLLLALTRAVWVLVIAVFGIF